MTRQARMTGDAVQTGADTGGRFPWVALFRLAVLRGICPTRVWQMCPAEIMSMLSQESMIPPIHAPMRRRDLQALMQAEAAHHG
jgi:hypothetical protein